VTGVLCFYEDRDTDVYSGDPATLAAWNYALRCAGDIKRFYVYNRTDETLQTPNADLEFKDCHWSDNVWEHLSLLPGRKTLVVTPWAANDRTVPLWQYRHDTDWYLFGPAAGWPKPLPDWESVTIPQHGRAACHAPHIATAVMLHRYEVLG
jgi:hypothetical protein